MILKNFLVEIYTEIFTDDVMIEMCFKIREGESEYGDKPNKIDHKWIIVETE